MSYNDDDYPIVEHIKFRDKPNNRVEVIIRTSPAGFVGSYVAWASGKAFVSGAQYLDDIPPYRFKSNAIIYCLNAVRRTVYELMKDRISEFEIMERKAVQQPQEILWPNMAMRGEQLELIL